LLAFLHFQEIQFEKIINFFCGRLLGSISIVVWLFGYLSITSSFSVSIAPSLSPDWLYPRIVWGGIWGLLFILPMLQSRLLLKGAVLSLFPTAVQLFVVFPLKAHKGIAGLDLGLLTPLFVLFFNWVWGFVTALAIKIAR
jgi:hypothetical protein